MTFIRTKSVTLDMNFFLLYTHYKLKFKVYRSKTCYFVNKLATIIYLNYCFFGVEEFNF